VNESERISVGAASRIYRKVGTKRGTIGVLEQNREKCFIWITERCGQAPSAPLCILEVPGSNPGTAWPGVGFFQRFPHTITSWYEHRSHMTDMGNAGSVSTSLSTYHFPSAPILTMPIPNLPVSVAEKALESLSSPPPFGGEWKMYPFLSKRGIIIQLSTLWNVLILLTRLKSSVQTLENTAT
jgi:hypothetical protein